MSLKDVQKAYEKAGAVDPLWAILTDDKKRGGKWDPEDFFASGRKEIQDVMDYLDSLDVTVTRGNAFDFGCGVGRLTQGLCHHFERATGVDISNTMIEGANKFNKFGDNCMYITNTEPHLKCLETCTFDFVYTNIVLQHMAPRYQVDYIKEFFRILKPGGMALFQIRASIRPKTGSLAEIFSAFKNEHWKPFWKKVRGKPPIQVHTISPQLVEQTITGCGAQLIDIQSTDKRVRKSRQSLRYCALKPA
jgi:SAM-dependent methyltransferase